MFDENKFANLQYGSFVKQFWVLAPVFKLNIYVSVWEKNKILL